MEDHAEAWWRHRRLAACAAAWRAAAAASATRWESSRRARRHHFLSTAGKCVGALLRHAAARAAKREREALAARHWARRARGRALWALALGAAMRRSARIARLKAESHFAITAQLRGWEAWLITMAEAEAAERESAARGEMLRVRLLRPRCLRALEAWRDSAAEAAVKQAKRAAAAAHAARALRARALLAWGLAMSLLERRRRLEEMALASRPARLRVAGWGSWRAAVARGRRKAAAFHAASLRAAFSRLQKAVGAWRAAVTRRRAALVFASHVAALNHQVRAGPVSRPQSRARSHTTAASAAHSRSESRSRSRSPLGQPLKPRASATSLEQLDPPLPTLRGEGWGRAGAAAPSGGAEWPEGPVTQSRRVSLSLSSSEEGDNSQGGVSGGGAAGSRAPQPRLSAASADQAVWDAVRRAESAGATTSAGGGPFTQYDSEALEAAPHARLGGAAVLAPASSALGPGAGPGTGPGRNRPAPRRPAILYDLSLPLTPNVAATLSVPTADTAAAAAALLGGNRGEPPSWVQREQPRGHSQRAPVGPQLGVGEQRPSSTGRGQAAANAAAGSAQPQHDDKASWLRQLQQRADRRPHARGAEENDPAARLPPQSAFPSAPPPLSPRSARAAGLIASELLGACSVSVRQRRSRVRYPSLDDAQPVERSNALVVCFCCVCRAVGAAPAELRPVSRLVAPLRVRRGGPAARTAGGACCRCRPGAASSHGLRCRWHVGRECICSRRRERCRRNGAPL